jgi:hypothetical protein
VPVYPCLSQSGLLYRPPRGKGEPQPPAAWNAAALRGWEAGADGIYVFNLFPGPGTPAERAYAVEVLKTIGSKERLREADRAFAVSDAGASMPAHFWANSAEEYAGALPVPLGERAQTKVSLVAAGRSEGFDSELRLDFTGMPDGQVPTVHFNGRHLERPNTAETVAGVRRFRLAVPASVVREGANTFALQPVAGGVRLAGAELWLRHQR